jgi:glycerol-3-phosphate dehydrogenase
MGSLSRAEGLDRLRSREAWDLLIVGGGATGLGTAVDAASRGYTVLLLEAADFAQGTSSRSTKLVHGGVRYLAQANIPLVREALHERGLLLRNAPHLVQERAFLIPAYHAWQLPYYRAGLWLYDRLAGRLGLGASRWVGRDESIRRVPTLKSAGLWGGIVYSDGQFDDARLAIALARTAADRGATLLNYVPVTALRRENGRLCGAIASDAETGETFEVRARAVVNATGVFADELRRLDDPDAREMIAPSQGAHVVLDPSFLPGDTAIMIPRTDDGRVLFAIPWEGRALLGTTDTPVGETSREPRPLAEELGFLLAHAGRYLSKPPGPTDVKSVFAGLRPLIRPPKARAESTSRLSREHAVVVSRSGLVTITGGKWTTYRTMARDAVEHAAKVGGLPERPCVTAELKLHDRESEELPALIRAHPEWNQPFHPDLPCRAADVVQAVRNEAARRIEDVLARRTRCLILDARASKEVARRVAAVMAEELGRDRVWQEEETARFQGLADRYLMPGS